MKYLSALLLISILLTSCGGDECPNASFQDQTLKGMIGGSAWFLTTGKAEISFFDNDRLSVELTIENNPNICDSFNLSGRTVLFDIDRATGLYVICFKLDRSGSEQTLTIYDGFSNNIVTAGAIEILTITDNELTGRIDGRFDDNNFVNGNFSVPLCGE